MRNFAAITAGGVLGVLLLKLLASVFFPLLAMMVGVLMVGLKLLFFAAVAYFVYSMLFKRRKEREGTA